VYIPLTLGVPEIVIVLDAQVAETPAGKPLAPETPLFEIPVAPTVVCVIFVKALLIHKVGVELAAVTELTEITVTTIALLGDEEQTVPPELIKAEAVYEADVLAVYVGAVATIDDPLLHLNTEPSVPDAVKTTLPPVQKVVSPPALIVGVAGCDTTVTVVGALCNEQPNSFVTVTVYDPEVVAVYVCAEPTTDDPLLQEYNVPTLELKTTLSPVQKVNGSPSKAVIVAVGKGLIVTALAALETLLQSVPVALTTA
jgi:hypothetical protein